MNMKDVGTIQLRRSVENIRIIELYNRRSAAVSQSEKVKREIMLYWSIKLTMLVLSHKESSKSKCCHSIRVIHNIIMSQSYNAHNCSAVSNYVIA